MSGWNHRVIEFKDYWDTPVRGIYEVYYFDDGKPQMYGDATMEWDEGEDPMKLIEQFKAALDKPVILREDFPDGGGHEGE